MNERKPIGKKLRFEVLKRDKFTCQYCGRMSPDVILEIDHIKPVADGGTNEILNLITSCRDCNRGKGKRKLSDDSLVKKQQAQIKELAEKQEQLEMLIEWKLSLQDFGKRKSESVKEYFESVFECTVKESGIQKIESWVNQFSVEEIIEAIDIAYETYSDTNTAFNKVSGICNNRKRQKKDPQLYYYNYSLKVCKDKYGYANSRDLHELIYEHIFSDEDFEDLKSLIFDNRNWTKFYQQAKGVF